MKEKLAVQMYTLRDFTKTKKDFGDSLEKVSAMGYPAVQLSGIGCMNGDNPEVTAEEAKKMLDDNGLKCIATHRGFPQLENDIQKEIDFHKALDCDYVAIGALPYDWEKPLGLDEMKEFLDKAKPVVSALNDADLRFGYHNHSFEFKTTGKGKETIYEYMIENTSPEFTFEMDLYWVWNAGFHPSELLSRLSNRVPVVHVKDMAVFEKESTFAAIGEGNMPWDQIIRACDAAGTEWYAVEQDTCDRDPFDCVKSSFEYLSNLNVLASV
ncbi:MAG: xylose isomerase [Planctomycetota bacterium]|nr:MAG: xylose isomerase [Planctomycetota bacterium]